MNRFPTAYAAILFAVALGACDQRDREEDPTRQSSESGMPNSDASTEGAMRDGAATDGMAIGDTGADAATANSMNPPPDTLGANNGMNGETNGGTNSGTNGGTTTGTSNETIRGTTGGATGGATSSTNGGTPSGTTSGMSGGANRAASAGAASTGGAGPGSGTTKGSNGAGSADADFYRQALSSGASEVALSEHAARTASSAEVKRIAGMLVADHRELNAKLGAASGLGEGRPSPVDANAAEDIKSRTGAAFDAAYLQKISDGYRKSIALYETASKSADTETRRLATAALPKLRERAGQVDRALAAMRGTTR